MKCAFLITAPDSENAAEILLSLALNDGFYVNQETFEKELKLIPQKNGELRAEVYGELAENLLAWAKQKTALNFKNI